MTQFEVIMLLSSGRSVLSVRPPVCEAEDLSAPLQGENIETSSSVLPGSWHIHYACWCETDAFKGRFQLRGHYVINTQTHVLYVKKGLFILTF